VDITGEGFDKTRDSIYFVPLSGWNSFYNVTIPKTLLVGALKVEVNGTTLLSTIDWNATYYLISFHVDSTSLINICGERCLPILGDINDSGNVDIFDAILLASHFNETN